MHFLYSVETYMESFLDCASLLLLLLRCSTELLVLLRISTGMDEVEGVWDSDVDEDATK